MTILGPQSSIKADYSNDQTYVLKLATAQVGGQVVVAASLSNYKVKLYQFDGSSLRHYGDLTGHQGVITDMVFPIESQPDALLTSSQDGTVKLWDVKNMQCTATYKADDRELHCCSIGRGGNSIAAGCDAAVLFWDKRSARPQGSFTDSFAEAVTQVRFYPGSDHVLFAGDVDGLCCVFDTQGKLSEDAGFRSCVNIGTSVAEMGLFGPRLDKMWLRSTTETLHLWDWSSSLNESGLEGAGELKIENPRQECMNMAASCGFTPLAQATDYLIGCEYNPQEDSLYLLAGNSTGSAGAFKVVASNNNLSTQPGATVTVGPMAIGLTGAHEEVVRSVLWPLASGHHVITGAEDSRIAIWGPASQQQQQGMMQGLGGDAGEEEEGAGRGNKAGRAQQHGGQNRGGRQQHKKPY